MKKEFPILNLILILLSIGTVYFLVTHDVFKRNITDSEYVMKHIRDIETHALSLLPIDGIYTYDELDLDIFLEENIDMRCESYNVTKENVIAAVNCNYNDISYCYESGKVSICPISSEENSNIEPLEKANENNEVKEEKKEAKPITDQNPITDLDRIKSYLASAKRFYEQAKTDSSKKLLLGHNVKKYLDVNTNDITGLVTVNSDGSIELRLALNDVCYIKKFASENIEVSSLYSSCYEKSSTMTNTVLVNNQNDKFMPDKYNTGVDPNTRFTVYNINNKLGPFSLKTSGTVKYKGATYPKAIITAATLKNNAPGNYVFENYDFTNYGFYVYDSVDVKEDITITFRNCKFLNVNVAKNLNSHIKIVIENSTLASFSGSNTTFKRCKIGNNEGDGLVPFYNVSVISSYIANHSRFSTDAGLHLDGTQIYGQAGIDVTNIHYYNTRFENPPLSTIVDGVKSTTYTNAAIMLQLEYSNGNDITFEKIYANGGGYTIYSWCKKNTNTTFKNVLLKDIKIGYGNIYGKVYSIVSPGATLENIEYVDRLAVGSIWKDNKGVHISVTNEMLMERELTCVTNKGTYKFNIPAHPLLGEKKNGKWVMYGANYTFNDMPYDIDTLIKDTGISTISIYDTTGGKSLLITTYKF